MALGPGTRLGHYEVADKIGAGGMGEVYRASDTKLRRDVAIKILPAEVARDEERLTRFRREAQLLAALNHPNIASIYGFEQYQDQALLVLELVEGEDLSERLKQGPIPVDEALVMARAIAGALEDAHEKGIIHRDLKPANVKLTRDETIKVLDFGLAKAFGTKTAEASSSDFSASPTISQGTGAGVILGTAAYMSPEQAKGKDLDRRTDIFSFGVMVFEMLTARKPFSGEDVSETLAAILRDEPDWSLLPDAIPTKARDLLKRCLRKNPRERLRDIGDARLLLDEALREDAPEATPTATATKPVSWLGFALAGLMGAAVCGAFLLALMRTDPPKTKRFSISLPAVESLARGPGSPIVLTPGGDTLVYVGYRDGVYQLHRRRLDELEATVIDRTLDARHPFLSPDGQTLGFYQGGGIFTAPLDGGLPTKLVDLGMVPSGPSGAASWGWDGFIYFVPAENAPVFRVPASGGDPEAVTSLDTDAGELAHLWPEALPNGKGVLFTVWSGTLESTRLAVHAFATGRHRILSSGTQPRYVPTGHLLFTEGFTLYAAPFDIDRLELTGGAVPMADNVEVNPTGAGQFAVTPYGNGILGYVVSSGTGGRDSLMWVNRTGEVGGRAIADPEHGLRAFRLSPDGDRVVVQTARPRGGLWVYDLTGRPPIPLTIDELAESPVWEPGGRRVAFLSYSPRVVYRIASDGSESEPELLVRDVNLASLWTYTPDGREVLGDRIVGNGRMLVSYPIDGGEPRTILQTDSGEMEAALSPDGRFIAYTSSATGRQEIWIRPFDKEGPPIRVSSQGGLEPGWSADGSELYFRRRGPASSTPDLFAVSVVAEPALRVDTPRLLFSFPFLTPYTPTYDVGRDGRFLMVGGTPGEGTGELVLVLDWFSELERMAPTR